MSFYSNILLLVLFSTILTTCWFQCSLPHFQTVVNDLHSLLNSILNFSHILLRCEYFLGTFFFQSMFSLKIKRHFTVTQNRCQFYGFVLFLAAVENRCNGGFQIWILRSISWLVLIILFLNYVFTTVVHCRLGANESIQSVVWWCWNFNNLLCISFFTLLCCIHGVDDLTEFLTDAVNFFIFAIVVV